MTHSIRAAAAAVCLFAGVAAAESFRDECEAVQAALAEPMKAGAALITAGNTDEANRQLLAVFPDATRTAAQAFMLGNLIYDLDPTLSYKLHHEAYDKAPAESMAAWEWAMERHRAREYAEAAKLYQASIAANPQRAVAYAMLADCLIHTDTPEAAAKAWDGSEKAANGSIEAMEEMVCAVYKNPWQNRLRDTLLAKVEKGDVNAAVMLLGLDCRWEQDWWNTNPRPPYLLRDADVIEKAKLPASERTRAIACVLECFSPNEPSKESVSAALKRNGFMIDDKATLPTDGVLTALLLRAALDNDVLTAEAVRKTFGPRLVETARKTRDFDWWNSTLYAFTGEGLSPAESAKLEKEAWDATGAPIFAIGYLAVEMSEKKQLAADDPVLVASLRRWPEHADLCRYAVIANRNDPAKRRDAIIQAVKAEYTHFSSRGESALGLNVRPRASTLRGYFKILSTSPRPPASQP